MSAVTIATGALCCLVPLGLVMLVGGVTAIAVSWGRS